MYHLRDSFQQCTFSGRGEWLSLVSSVPAYFVIYQRSSYLIRNLALCGAKKIKEGITQTDSMLKRGNEINKAMSRVLYFYLMAIVVSLTSQLSLQPFYLYSAGLLVCSLSLVHLLIKLSYEMPTKRFLFSLQGFTLIYGLSLAYIVGNLLINSFGTPFIGLDDATYQAQQTDIANNLTTHYGALSDNTLMAGFYSGYPNFGGILMYLVGSKHWLVPRVATVLLHVCSIIPFYRIVSRYSTVGSSLSTTILYAISPMILTLQFLQLKDGLLITLLVLSTHSILNLIERRKLLLYLPILTLCLFAMITIRAMVIVAFLVSILLFYVLRKQKGSIFVGLSLSALIVVGVLYLWSWLATNGIVLDPEAYYSVRMEFLGDSGRMAGEASQLSSTWYVALVSAPLFIVMSPFVPIPSAFVFENPLYPSTNFEFSANVFLYALLPLFFVSIYRILKDRQTTQAPLFILLFFFVYKVGSALSGMTIWSYRQTLPATLAVLLLIPIGLDTTPTKTTKRIKQITSIILVVLLFAWTFFRTYIRQ